MVETFLDYIIYFFFFRKIKLFIKIKENTKILNLKSEQKFFTE